ncbi:MAG: MATE family efflux transporter, partial [Erysipelotrichaceae bacterium]|nr:MATE family efflux transporter [Erysipelotrichaceae bacterium]
EGIIWKQLLIFVWPVFVSNIFQRLYDITNQLIVGNFVSRDALSAVSSVSTITNVFQMFFGGISLGSGIIVARFYGARLHDKLKGVIETSIIFTIVGGTVSTVLTELMIPFLLDAINVNASLYSMARSYLRVYVLGNAAVFTYNICFHILRSIGDTKKPLYYLILSSVINIVLGVIFVRVLDLSVIGTALATIIAQFTVDILSLRMIAGNELFSIDLRHMKFDWQIFRDICAIGVPAGIQNMLFNFSNILLQGKINLFDNAAIAGIGVAQKLSGWAQLPMSSINTINTAYIGQNYGAKKYDRVQKEIKVAVFITTAVTVLTAGLMWINAEFLVSLFNKDPDVLRYGTEMTRFVVFFYVGLGISHIYNGACRATGNVRIPLIIAVFSQAFVKYMVVAIWLKFSFDVRAVYVSTATGAFLPGVLAALYFHTSRWTKENHLRA